MILSKYLPLAVWLCTVSVSVVEGQKLEADTLAEVQISVLRTPFDLSRSPFSVSYRNLLSQRNSKPGSTFKELLSGISGIQVDNRMNRSVGERIAIRGMGSRSQFGVRGIRIVVDEIPATLADGQTVLNNVDLSDVATLQVIRGPASALYGNASGGVILMETKSPAFEPVKLDSRFLGGSNRFRRIQSSLRGGVNNTGYAIAASRVDDGGFRDFSAAHTGHLNGLLFYTSSRGQTKLVVNSERHRAQNPGSLSDSLVHVNRRQAFANNISQQTGDSGYQTQLGVSTQQSLSLGELRLSGHTLLRKLNNPIPPRIIEFDRKAGGARGAYAVSSKRSWGSINALGGLEFNYQYDDRQNYINEAGISGDLVLDQDERVLNTAPFAQLTVSSGSWALLFGLRYDRTNFRAKDKFITSDNPDDSGERTLSSFSSSGGISYRPTSSLTLYANAAQSFQTPTTTELANQPDGAGGFNPALEPERTQSVEIGIRGDLLQADVRSQLPTVNYNLAVYWMRVRDILIPFEVPSFAGRQFFRNAGAARHIGFEADVGIEVSPIIAINASYTYIRATFLSDTLGDENRSNAGNRIPGIIPHITSISVNSGSPGGWTLSTELQLCSSVFVNDDNTVLSEGYSTLNLRGQSPVWNGIAVFGGLNNVFDRKHIGAVVVNAFGGRYFEPAAGRAGYLGLRLERSW